MLLLQEDMTIGDLLDRPDEVRVRRLYEETIGTYIDAGKKPPLKPEWRRDRYHLRDFVRDAWHVVETQPYKPGWHIDAICDHLEAVIESCAPERHQDLPEIRNLLVNIPPRCSKSIICAVMLPSWAWISFPECTFLYVSYSQQLALRDAEKARQLMQSNFYQSRWGDQWKFSSSQAVKSFYYNDRLGYRFSTSVSGAATGFGATVVIGDDLHSAAEDHSETRAEIESAKAFWRDVIPSRSEDPTKMRKIVVGQRIAVDDVSEMLMEQGNYARLVIPMEMDDEGREVAARTETPLDFVDPRLADDSTIYLQPDRFTPEVVAEYKLLGRRYNAQYQQNPQSEGTTLYPRQNWRFFTDWPDMDWFDVIVQSWDFRFTDEKTASTSYVAGHIWGRRGPDVFLLDRFFERASFDECIKAVVHWTKKWPTAYGKLLEQKANGPAILQTLRAKVPGLIPVQVGGQNLRKGGGTKYQRAEAVSWIQKAGNAWLPHPRLAPWVNDYINNMFRFPATPDDDTDATSQAWRYLVPLTPAKDENLAAARRRKAYLQQKFKALQGGRKRPAASRTGA